MYTIKQTPEDFIVKEIPLYELAKEGDYSYFWLKKRNYNTIDAIRKIATVLQIPLKNIGFAGTKDKIAITEQVISIRKLPKQRGENLKLKDIQLTYIGKGKNPISLGDLKANRFRIVVRNLPKRFLAKSIDKIPNLFGPQRFSKHNAEIGKALIKRNFKKAIDLIDSKTVINYIGSDPGDFIGALRTLPSKLRKLFIHAYQSLLWNETVKEYLKTDPYKNEKIPIIGFGLELTDNEINKIIRKIMSKENIQPRDFIIPQIPELSSEGGERDLFIKPENFKILKKEKDSVTVTFTLQKASYATVVIEFLFFKAI